MNTTYDRKKTIADRKTSTCMEPLNSFELAYLFNWISNSKEQMNLNKKFGTILFPLCICSDVWFHNDTVTSSNFFLKTSYQKNKQSAFSIDLFQNSAKMEMGEGVHFYNLYVNIFCVGSVFLKDEKKIDPTLLILILANTKLWLAIVGTITQN